MEPGSFPNQQMQKGMHPPGNFEGLIGTAETHRDAQRRQEPGQPGQRAWPFSSTEEGREGLAPDRLAESRTPAGGYSSESSGLGSGRRSRAGYGYAGALLSAEPWGR